MAINIRGILCSKRAWIALVVAILGYHYHALFDLDYGVDLDFDNAESQKESTTTLSTTTRQEQDDTKITNAKDSRANDASESVQGMQTAEIELSGPKDDDNNKASADMERKIMREAKEAKDGNFIEQNLDRNKKTTGLEKDEDNILQTGSGDHNGTAQAGNEQSNEVKVESKLNTSSNWTYPSKEDLEKLQSCFPYNSKDWLQGPRHGNRQDPLMSKDFVSNMILFGDNQSTPRATINHDDVSVMLQQSLCLNQSRFLNASDSFIDDRSINLWIVRLTYMAIHKVQHQFAVPEVAPRTSLSEACQELAQQNNIGSFDYECSAGKFLVVSIENLGLGAVTRTQVIGGYMAALATNRTLLLINNASPDSSLPKRYLEPLHHGSCPRHDIQCFFHAPSPCVLNYQQLQNATELDGYKQISNFYKNPSAMMQQAWFQDSPIILLKIRTIARTMPLTIPSIVRQFAADYRKAYLSSKDPRHAVLQRVEERLGSQVHRDNVNQFISYGMVMYALRPHLRSQQQLAKILEANFPSTKRYHPDAMLGLPIRASDKCYQESECLTFEQYMRVMAQIWNRNKSNITQAMNDASLDQVSIVSTTESASVIKEKDDFLADKNRVKELIPFQFDFTTNDFDIQQDSGNPLDNLPEHNMMTVLEKNNADQVMLSMISSLQAQLMAGYSVGNCCSNFHRLLLELLDGGCGAAYHANPECLQRNPEPEFRICCLWDKRKECEERKVKETIDRKWKAVRQQRMQERRRRMQQKQEEELN